MPAEWSSPPGATESRSAERARGQDQRQRGGHLNMKLLLPLLLCAGACFRLPAEETTSAKPPEASAQPDTRVNWWCEARFGMFIHWGLYSLAAGEWNGKP